MSHWYRDISNQLQTLLEAEGDLTLDKIRNMNDHEVYNTRKAFEALLSDAAQDHDDKTFKEASDVLDNVSKIEKERGMIENVDPSKNSTNDDFKAYMQSTFEGLYQSGVISGKALVVLEKAMNEYKK